LLFQHRFHLSLTLLDAPSKTFFELCFHLSKELLSLRLLLPLHPRQSSPRFSNNMFCLLLCLPSYCCCCCSDLLSGGRNHCCCLLLSRNCRNCRLSCLLGCRLLQLLLRCNLTPNLCSLTLSGSQVSDAILKQLLQAWCIRSDN
jgi:hypothetical protein